MTCRTPDEAFQAGWRDAAADPPLSREQVISVALLLAPCRQPAEAA